ncbi:hypothetical protein F5Y17DRAFT_165397 [Xylariaceae sp. FL0594]|nr:hypothetical protein F5Y17DRAFT_165397 [Xylariaceae sp. FL0594]
MCECRVITKLCTCRHKERIRYRCYWNQLRRSKSCLSALAVFAPSCHPHRERHRVERICIECRDFFYRTYGRAQYKEFAKIFLAYKESRGWHKTAIDPRTIPHEVLVHHRDQPSDKAAAKVDPVPYGYEHPMGISLLQPMPDYAAKMEGRAPPSPSPSPRRTKSIPLSRNVEAWKQNNLPPLPSSSPEKVVHVLNDEEVRGVTAELHSYSYGRNKQNTKPLPGLPATDPGCFVIGEEEEEEEEEVDDDDNEESLFACSPSPILSRFPRVPTPRPTVPEGKQRAPKPLEEPQPVYTRAILSPGQIVPELSHLAKLSRDPSPVDSPELQHPRPMVPIKKRGVTDSLTTSEASLVTKLRERAESMERRRQFVPDEDGIPVPILDDAPRKLRHRQSALRRLVGEENYVISEAKFEEEEEEEDDDDDEDEDEESESWP